MQMDIIKSLKMECKDNYNSNHTLLVYVASSSSLGHIGKQKERRNMCEYEHNMKPLSEMNLKDHS